MKTLPLFAIFAATSSFAADSSGVDEVKRLQAAFRRALVQNDTTTVASFLTDDFIRTPPAMPATTKAEWIAQLQNGGVRYVSIEMKDAKYRAFGTTVLVHAVSHIRARTSTTELDNTYRLLFVWVKQDTGWHLAAVHGNEAP